jgi:hypothetical protein
MWVICATVTLNAAVVLSLPGFSNSAFEAAALHAFNPEMHPDVPYSAI